MPRGANSGTSVYILVKVFVASPDNLVQVSVIELQVCCQHCQCFQHTLLNFELHWFRRQQNLVRFLWWHTMIYDDCGGIYIKLISRLQMMDYMMKFGIKSWRQLEIKKWIKNLWFRFFGMLYCHSFQFLEWYRLFEGRYFFWLLYHDNFICERFH